MKLIPNLGAIDRQAIHELGIPGLLLMESAGSAVANRVKERLKTLKQKSARIVVVSGRGNNGGDGFVCARHLAMEPDCLVTVIHTAVDAEMTGDALENYRLLTHQPVKLISNMLHNEVDDVLATADIIIDALFGSGLSRPVQGAEAELICKINAAGAYVVAVDLPSGINSATGQKMGIAVRADETVTFAAAKPGLYLYPGKACAGEIHLADIGIPQALIEADPSRVFAMTMDQAAALLPQRIEPSHKYTYGAVLVIAGSRNMPGAAVMSAEAALRAGAGMVFLASPASALQGMALPPEIIHRPLPETPSGTLSRESLAGLSDLWPKITTVAVGPGLTQEPPVVDFVQSLLELLQQQFQGIAVLDADALNCLSRIEPVPTLSERFILTPHLGEAARLMPGFLKERMADDLLSAAQELTRRYQAATVLKSATTITAQPGGACWLNTTGNAGMATAGSGDILTGILAGFAAQGLSTGEAARLSAYLHGLAGDNAAKALTQYCMTATDLLRYLPEAIRQLQFCIEGA